MNATAKLSGVNETGPMRSGLRWPLFVAAILLVLVTYAPTTASILSRWYSDPTYSHGFLVAAASGWMIWRVWRRGELENTRPAYVGMIPMLLVGLIWLLATSASVVLVQQLALPALLLAAAWAMFGWRGLVALLVPIGVIYCVLPAWDYIRVPLQDMTTFSVGVFLQALGIPAFISGHYVEISAGRFVIAEGCSGLHFFMAGTALAVIQGYLFVNAMWARVLLIFAAAFVAIIANWIRVAGVIVAGHLTNMQHFLISDHYYFGWVVFFILMIPVIYVGHRFAAPPVVLSKPRLSGEFPRRQRGLVLAVFLALVFPALAWTVMYKTAEVAPIPELPRMVGEWALSGGASDEWQPVHPGADRTLSGQYTDGARDVDIWVVYYSRQSAGRELVGYGSRISRPEDGRVVRGVVPGELLLQKDLNTYRLMKYQYIVNGKITRSGRNAKIYQIAGNLRGRPSAYGVFVSTRCTDPECSDARQALDEVEAKFVESILAPSDFGPLGSMHRTWVASGPAHELSSRFARKAIVASAAGSQMINFALPKEQ